MTKKNPLASFITISASRERAMALSCGVVVGLGRKLGINLKWAKVWGGGGGYPPGVPSSPIPGPQWEPADPVQMELHS